MSEATIATLVGTIIGALLGWLGGLIQSGAAEDRARLIRHRGLANALLADVRRIEEELGPREQPDLRTSINGSQPQIPQISEWLRSLIPEIAQADPEVLRLFLRLDRQLGNDELLEGAVARAREEVGANTPTARLSEIATGNQTLSVLMENLAQMAESARERATQNLAEMESQRDKSRVQSFQVIDNILLRLEPLAGMDIPSLVPFAIERVLPAPAELKRSTWIRYAGNRLPAVSPSAGRP